MRPLLDRLDTEDYDTIIANSKKMEVEKDHLIFKEGSPSNYMYFIHIGEVRLYKEVDADKEITIFTRCAKDAFGEIGIFSGTKYSNTARATKKCTLYYIEKDVMEMILTENGKLGLQITKWVAESLESSKSKIRDFIAFGSEGAIASVFVRYSNMYGIVTLDGIRIEKPIMIQDISRQIGISRETVSRVVNKWKAQGIVTSTNKQFLIKDMNFFRKLLVCEKCGVENCVL